MEVLRINENDLKELRETIGKYVGTKTSSSLSMLLGEPVSHRIRRIVEINLSDLESIIPVFDIIPMCSVCLKGQGDISIMLLFFMPTSMARKFAAKLLGVKTMKKLSSLGRSSISEVGNMLTGSFFNALSDGTGFQIDLSVPGFAVNTFKASLESSTIEIANVTDSVIVADAELHGVDSGIIVNVLILLGPSEAKKLLAASRK
ncbi:MAG: chemotaxis protein CheC [Thaumarchaeota archaeon]|nr:chemotaxis protein CheC [Nitrososphaerota archaeon]MBI3641140.1 chemotaxis protein CheC [Nitrososphaerota archaeon]